MTQAELPPAASSGGCLRRYASTCSSVALTPSQTPADATHVSAQPPTRSYACCAVGLGAIVSGHHWSLCSCTQTGHCHGWAAQVPSCAYACCAADLGTVLIVDHMRKQLGKCVLPWAPMLPVARTSGVWSCWSMSGVSLGMCIAPVVHSCHSACALLLWC